MRQVDGHSGSAGERKRKAEVIAATEKLAWDVWESFQDLGREFEAWLLLAVNGVLMEKEGDEEATLEKVARVIRESGVLQQFDLDPPLSTLTRALSVLRMSPEIVPRERRAYLRKVSRQRNVAAATERSHELRSIENRIGGAEKLWEILSRDEAWWPDNRMRIGYIQKQLRELSVEMSHRAAARWLEKMLKRPEAEAAGIPRQPAHMVWTAEANEILREIFREPASRLPDGRRSIEYLVERFYMETGIDLSRIQMKNHLKTFSEEET